jgi:delta24-sterol reductase
MVNSNFDGVFEHILINYRWFLVCFFLLPASLIYEVWNYARNWIVFKLSSAPGHHNKKIIEVQKQVSKKNYHTF